MSRTLVLMAIVFAGTTADARVRLNIVRSAYCGVDCPVDAIEQATLEVAGSRRHGARGSWAAFGSRVP